MSARPSSPGQSSPSPGHPAPSTPTRDSAQDTSPAETNDSNASNVSNVSNGHPSSADDDYTVLPSETNTGSTPSNPVDPTRRDSMEELDFSIGPPGQMEEDEPTTSPAVTATPTTPTSLGQRRPSLDTSAPVTVKDFARPPFPTPHFQEPTDSPRMRSDDALKRATSIKRSPSIKGTLGGRRASHGHSSRPHRPSILQSTPRTPRSTQSQATAPSTPQPPILSLTPAVASDQPEFAELLTPAQLRKRRKQRVPPSQLGTGLGVLAGRPILAGPSRLGFATPDGDLYRGATENPVAPTEPTVVDDDAITVASSASSDSSASGIGARATDLVHRVGEAIGMRRGSSSSGSDSSSSTSSSASTSGFSIGRFGRALTRTMSRATNDSAAEERPKRVYVPRRREFTLLLPPGEKLPQKPNEATIITTPMLPPILEAIRSVRATNGIAGVLDVRPHLSHRKHHHHSDLAVRRGGSAPGRKRAQFVNPPIPRMPRVEALRGAGPVRPKSASDLLGLAAGPGRNHSSPDLASVRSSSGSSTDSSAPPLSPTPTLRPQPKPAWWLDVSCPTWKDLRDIGELLALHPLTLEDVLHQDPREKLDTFHKLGYYFVVIRALDEQYFKYTPGTSGPPGTELEITNPNNTGHRESDGGTKERRRRGWGFGRATGRAATKIGEKVEIVENDPGKEGLEGVGVGGINLYLVVFADGIVSFHYDDVSKHVTRVRDRVLQVQESVPSPDWIAHGLIDSIVDAFFPLMGYIDGAVDDMDSLTIDPTRDPRVQTVQPSENIEVPNPSDDPYSQFGEEHKWIDMEKDPRKFDEKMAVSTGVSTSTPQKTGLRQRRVSTSMFEAAKAASEKASAAAKSMRKAAAASAPKKTPLLEHKWARPLLYMRLYMFPTASAVEHVRQEGGEDVFDRSTMLRSIANMRRLVTGLSRMLGGKHTVVAALLKRTRDSADDVEAYLSDVHDHILLLQTSLYHYEYILSHCQPAYLSYLQVSGTLSRGGTDKLILALSTVTIGILPMQLVLGLFSMNVSAPNNGMSDPPEGIEEHRQPDGSLAPFNWFIIIVFVIVLIALGVLGIIRYWRWLARKKWTKRRGGQLPGEWDGFWGWR